jgi:hypothetical protein
MAMKRFTFFVMAMVLGLTLVLAPNLVEAKPQGKAKVHYQVTGQARVWEAAYSFRIKAGNKVLVEGHGTASIGAPEWGNFKEIIKVSKKKGKKLTLELFEISAKDGTEINKLTIPLDCIKGKTFHNKTFKNVKVRLI